MSDATPSPGQKPWQKRRRPVSVLAEMALRRETVPERLAQLRDEHGLTQEQAAQKVGVGIRQWQRWESGDSMPYPKNLDLIASRFGISIEEFFDPVQSLRGHLDRVEAKLDALLDHFEISLSDDPAEGFEQELSDAADTSEPPVDSSEPDEPAQDAEGQGP